MELSVVIPCLNEEQTIADCVRKAREAMAKDGIEGEVVVADNGSTDRSVERAAAAGARVVHCAARGYGNALRAGLAQARGRFLLMGDGDDSYDFSRLSPFVEKLRGGADLVMGTRLRGTILPGAMPFLNRRLGTPLLTALLNGLFGTRISDCNCGMRALTREAFERLSLQSEGMELASEMVIQSGRAGLRIAEAPIVFHKDRRGRPPHLRRWRDGWRHLSFMIRATLSR